MSVFTLAISCLTTSNLPWFMDLPFQVPMQYCSLQHQTLLSPPDTSTTEHCVCFGPATSFFLELFVIALCSSLISIPDNFQPGGLIFRCHLFAISYCSWGSRGKNTGMACHSLLQWTAFCQDSALWPVPLGWPCRAWLIASLSYTSPFATTSLLFIKGIHTHTHVCVCVSVCLSFDVCLGFLQQLLG